MIDLTTIKKYYLRYWVDRSQAARKAAEELAMKEVKPSLRDKYTYEVQNPDLVFTLDGHKVEFKDENEKNPKDPEYNFFTWDEAVELFGEPDLKDGWRLPTKEELKALKNDYPHEFKDEQGVIDNRLYLPVAGYRNCFGDVHRVGLAGIYWSSTPEGSDYAWQLWFNSGEAGISYCNPRDGQSVRLVRDV